MSQFLKLCTKTCIYKYGIILFNSEEYLLQPFNKEHSTKELLQGIGSLKLDEMVKSDQTLEAGDMCVHLQ